MDYKWTRVEDGLPDESGWYLVFAPSYTGGSSSGLDMHDGIMFSQFKIAKNGNKSWSIESGYYKRPNCVLYWAELPIPADKGHFEKRLDVYHRPYKVWIDNNGTESYASI